MVIILFTHFEQDIKHIIQHHKINHITNVRIIII